MTRKLAWLLFLLAGCSTPTPPQTAQSLWGAVYDLGITEQTEGPALAISNGQAVAVWVGADARGVHHDASAAPPAEDIVTLPLPPVHPHSQQLFAARDGKYYLLWLDANEQDETRLFAALLSDSLQVERGPILVSDRLTLRYTAAPQPDGGLLIVWSGGLPGEPTLYQQTLDTQARPQPAQHLRSDADWPTMAIANDGIPHLFWLNRNRQTFYGQVAEAGLNEVTSLQAGVPLREGDILHSLSAALDHHTVYLIWNITPLTAPPQSGFIARQADGTWQPARPLTLTTHETTIQTGLNSGQVLAASTGDTHLHWASPAAGQPEMLPLASYSAGELGMTYLQNGEVVGYQALSSATLAGAPQVSIDAQLHLYVTWAEINDAGLAQLRLTTTRP